MIDVCPIASLKSVDCQQQHQSLPSEVVRPGNCGSDGAQTAVLRAATQSSCQEVTIVVIALATTSFDTACAMCKPVSRRLMAEACMDGSAELYTSQRERLGQITYGGEIQTTQGTTVGQADFGGGGVIYGRPRRGGLGSSVGKVDSSGGIYRNGPYDTYEKVGEVSGKTVYYGHGRQVVGLVEGRSSTMVATGITDVHRAGASLLLLFHLGLGQE